MTVLCDVRGHANFVFSTGISLRSFQNMLEIRLETTLQVQEDAYKQTVSLSVIVRDIETALKNAPTYQYTHAHALYQI